MKSFLCLVFLALFLGTSVFAQEQAHATNPQWLGLGFPHPFFPLPRPGAMPPKPPVSDDQIKCFQAFHAPGMASCLQDLHSFFQSHKVSLNSGCCSALQNIEDTCQFQIPILTNLLGQCGGGGGSPPNV